MHTVTRKKGPAGSRRGAAGEKAERVYFSVVDIAKHFEKNPRRLVEYVNTGLRRRVSVLGVHLAQLAARVDDPLLYKGRVFKTLPEMFVPPDKFENINVIMVKAEGMFPGR